MTALNPLATALLLTATCLYAHAGDTTPAAQLTHWEAVAGQTGDAARGQAFFAQQHGREWSCASCHGEPPTRDGKHADTGKAIKPLAPAYNPNSLQSTAKTAKWFRRNCNDVLGRECTPIEKADFLSYLINIK